MKDPPRRPTLPMGLAPVGAKTGLKRSHPAHTRRTPRIDRYVKIGDEIGDEDVPFAAAKLPKEEVLDLWEELLPMLAWLPEDRRPQLLARIERSELSLVASELRAEQERYPKNVSISRAIRVVERSAIRILLRALEPLDRVPEMSKSLDDSRMRPTMFVAAELVDGKRSLNGIMRDAPLSRLETLSALEDLLVAGWIRFQAESLGQAISASLPPVAMSVRPAALPRDARPPREEIETPKARGVTTSPPPRGDQSGDGYPALKLELARLPSESPDEGDRPTLADPFVIEQHAELMRRAPESGRGAAARQNEAQSPQERPTQTTPLARTEPQEEEAPAQGESPLDDLPPTRRASQSVAPEVEIAAATEEDLAVDTRASDPPEPIADSPRPGVRSTAPGTFARPRASDPAPRSGSNSTLWAVSAIAALSTILALYFGLRSGDSSGLVPVPPSPAVQTKASEATSTATATATASAELALPENIRLRIDASPDYARVYLDGKKLKAPYEYSLPRDEGTRIIRVEAPGHRPRKLTFVPREDTRLVVGLEPLPKMPTAAPEPEIPDPY